MKNLAFHRVIKNTFIVLNKGMVQAYRKLNTIDGSFEVIKLGIYPHDLQLGQSISGVARVSRGNDRRVHFATHLFKHGIMKICSTKKDSEFPRVKRITLKWAMLNYIVRSRSGLLVGVFEDDRMWRYSKEFAYHLYIYKSDKIRLLYQQQNFLKGHQLFGMFKTSLDSGYASADIVVFVFRRNQAIFLKMLNVQNKSTVQYLLNIDKPRDLRKV